MVNRKSLQRSSPTHHHHPQLLRKAQRAVCSLSPPRRNRLITLSRCPPPPSAEEAIPNGNTLTQHALIPCSRCSRVSFPVRACAKLPQSWQVLPGRPVELWSRVGGSAILHRLPLSSPVSCNQFNRVPNLLPSLLIPCTPVQPFSVVILELEAVSKHVLWCRMELITLGCLMWSALSVLQIAISRLSVKR